MNGQEKHSFELQPITLEPDPQTVSIPLWQLDKQPKEKL
jgi:hypothetical protein